jgi:hypothetical protein
MFFLEYYDMLSGGALGALTVGMVTCYTWEQGKPARFSTGRSNSFSADVERVAAVVSKTLSSASQQPRLSSHGVRFTSLVAPLHSRQLPHACQWQ